MDNARLDSDTLAHVDDRYYLGAHCRKCGHHARLNISKLRDYLGAEYRLAKIKDRLRCERCGDRRQIVVKFIAPGESVGSVAYLFVRKLRR